MRLFKDRRAAIGAICLLCTVLLGAAHFSFRPLQRLDLYLRDLQACLGRKAPLDPRLVYLAIDEPSISLSVGGQLVPGDLEQSEALQQMSTGWPWPRDVYAMILDRLIAAGARVVAFDLLLPTPGAKDDILRAALERHQGRVVIGCSIAGRTVSLPSKTVVSPAAAPAASGFVNFFPDPDGVTRRAHYRTSLEELGGYPADDSIETFESFGARILTCLGRADLIPQEREGRLFRYAGPPLTVERWSVFQIFAPALWEANFARGEAFKDKIVVVGPDGQWFHDEHPSPFRVALGTDGMMPGPELHLQALNAALQGDFLSELPLPAILGIFAAVGMAAWGISLGFARPSLRPLFVLGGSAAYLVLVQVALSSSHYVMPTAAPLGILLTSTIASILLDFRRERKDKARIRATLERYVSPNLVKEILDNPQTYLNSLGGVRRRVTVLFIDLRGFTEMIEREDSAQLVTQLNEYYTALMNHVFDRDGTFDKIIGDALMAFWGYPHTEGIEGDARQAVRAALDMKATLDTLNARWRQSSLPAFRAGIGVAHGEVLAGNIGSQRQMNLTVIGDAVNLAARLQSLTKEYPTDLLISGDLAEMIRPDFALQSVDCVQVKGKAQATDVYTVWQGHDATSEVVAASDFLPRYEEGIQRYRSGDLEAAAGCFRECLEIQPAESFSLLYLKRCAADESAPPIEPATSAAPT